MCIWIDTCIFTLEEVKEKGTSSFSSSYMMLVWDLLIYLCILFLCFAQVPFGFNVYSFYRPFPSTISLYQGGCTNLDWILFHLYCSTPNYILKVMLIYYQTIQKRIHKAFIIKNHTITMKNKLILLQSIS